MTAAVLPPDLFGPDAAHQPQSIWQRIGFVTVVKDGRVSTQLPEGIIALRATNEAARTARTELTKRAGIPPLIIFKNAGSDVLLYRLENDQALERLRSIAPAELEVSYPHDQLDLPSEGNDASVVNVSRLGELSILPVIEPEPAQAPPPIVTVTPLSRFSLKGEAARFESEAQENASLLGDVCLSGQATVWYAPPNAGKTLIALSLLHDSVRAGLIAPDNVYYINADDNHAGLTAKLRLMEDLGVHMLAPGHKGFENRQLTGLLASAADRQQAKGVFVIVDTLKKFASLMDKKDSSALADACRRFVMGGGTILGLAHTAKNPNTNGSLRYAGTTDVLEDFDAAYVITPLKRSGDVGERVVEFSAIKRRGNSAETAAYAYTVETNVSYDHRVLSVHPIDPDNLDAFKRLETERSDAEIIEVVKAQITAGITQKMTLAAAVADVAQISKREAVRVIERYAGTDVEQHHWRMSVKARGAKVFELLTPAA